MSNILFKIIVNWIEIGFFSLILLLDLGNMFNDYMRESVCVCHMNKYVHIHVAVPVFCILIFLESDIFSCPYCVASVSLVRAHASHVSNITP